MSSIPFKPILFPLRQKLGLPMNQMSARSLLGRLAAGYRCKYRSYVAGPVAESTRMMSTGADGETAVNEKKQNVIRKKEKEQEAKLIFDKWAADYGMVYNGPRERQKRFKIFQNNLEFIGKINSADTGYRLELNPQSALKMWELPRGRAPYTPSPKPRL